jgi:hypothetical protein
MMFRKLTAVYIESKPKFTNRAILYVRNSEWVIHCYHGHIELNILYNLIFKFS